MLFTVDWESRSGIAPIPNEEIIDAAVQNPDVIVPFASVDPARPDALDRVRQAAAAGARGFKFHPNLQAFFPNDERVYPLYDAIAEAGVPALFHSGHSGIGTGVPGGGGFRLKYSNPMCLDDVAADFPELQIVLAHPSFPWQDEAISVCLHKANVWIDLSGWSPKYFPPQLVQYANTQLRTKVLFGSDYPLITPDRWLSDFADGAVQGRRAAADPEGERRPVARTRLSKRPCLCPHRLVGLMGTVETVRGTVDVESLGRALMHEHVFVMQPEALQNYGHVWGESYWDEDVRVADAIEKLRAVRAAGIETIVDPTAPGPRPLRPAPPADQRRGRPQHRRGERRVRLHRAAQFPRLPERRGTRRAVRARAPRGNRRHRRQSRVSQVRGRAARTRRRRAEDPGRGSRSRGRNRRARDGAYERCGGHRGARTRGADREQGSIRRGS